MIRDFGLVIVYSLWGVFIFGVILGMMRQTIVTGIDVVLKRYLADRKEWIKAIEEQYGDGSSSIRAKMYH
jgi:hypothetical protein